MEVVVVGAFEAVLIIQIFTLISLQKSYANSRVCERTGVVGYRLHNEGFQRLLQDRACPRPGGKGRSHGPTTGLFHLPNLLNFRSFTLGPDPHANDQPYYGKTVFTDNRYRGLFDKFKNIVKKKSVLSQNYK